MSFLRSLVRETRDLTKLSTGSRRVTDLFEEETHAGVQVSQASAVRLVAVYACIRLRAETIASLPADVFQTRGEEREAVAIQPSWVEQPNPETTWFEFVERINSSLDLDGNAYVIITARDASGYPSECWTLHPRDVEVQRQGRELVYIWEGSERLSRYSQLNIAGDVLHIKNFSTGEDKGLSPIGIARQAIALGLATEKFGARFFGAGQTLSGVIEIPTTDARKGRQFIKEIKENWQESHGGTGRSHLPGVLTGGATWKPIAITPDEAQFLETRKFQVSEIARLFGIPPHMIGDVERSTSWGSGIEQQSIGFVQYSIAPRLVRLEHALNQLVPRGQFLKWNVNGLLRGDARSRAEFYAKGIREGYLVRADARRLEDLPAIDGLEKPLIQKNMTVVGEEEEDLDGKE